MSDETKAPARDVAEVIEIMRPIFDWAPRGALKCAQLRDGLAVATDGRVLVRVDALHAAVNHSPAPRHGTRAPWIDPETGLVVARFADANALANPATRKDGET